MTHDWRIQKSNKEKILSLLSLVSFRIILINKKTTILSLFNFGFILNNFDQSDYLVIINKFCRGFVQSKKNFLVYTIKSIEMTCFLIVHSDV